MNLPEGRLGKISSELVSEIFKCFRSVELLLDTKKQEFKIWMMAFNVSKAFLTDGQKNIITYF